MELGERMDNVEPMDNEDMMIEADARPRNIPPMNGANNEVMYHNNGDVIMRGAFNDPRRRNMMIDEENEMNNMSTIMNNNYSMNSEYNESNNDSINRYSERSNENMNMSQRGGRRTRKSRRKNSKKSKSRRNRRH